MQAQHIMYQKEMEILNNYMKKKSISEELQYRARNYVDYQYMQQQDTTTEKESKVLAKMSQNIRDSMMKESLSKIFQYIPIFEEFFSEGLVQKTMLLMKEVRITPDEIIIEQ